MAAKPQSNYTQLPQRERQEAVQTAPHIVQSVTRPWHYGLCVMCTEMNSCLECWCCMPCQMGRQYNVHYHNEAELHVPVCIALTLLDGAGVPASFALQYIIRSDIRRRYGIEGGVVSDCCVSWLCLPCAVQQQFLELTSVGACPGMSMCGVSPVTPAEPTMV